jgi:hypothetical protein
MNSRDYKTVRRNELLDRYQNKKLVTTKKNNSNSNMYQYDETTIKNKLYYDIIIIIPSKDRYDYLINILNDLISQSTKYTFKIIVLNDASIDGRYKNIPELYNNITYLENIENFGKHLYWKSINKLFFEASKYSFRFLLQIDDDFKLCNNFLDRLIIDYTNAKNKNNKIICLDYRIMNDWDELRWGCGKSWIDGCGLYEHEFIRQIKFKIDPINKLRWRMNKDISSGVWQQISKKINLLGYIVYKNNKRLVEHIKCETQMQK